MPAPKHRALREAGPWWFAISLNLLFSIALATLRTAAGLLGNPLVAFACDTVIRVFAVSFTCLLFLYYWEARKEEQNAESGIPETPTT